MSTMRTIICAVTLWLAGCAATVTQSIPNFAVVDTERAIYRGGEPSVQGWTYLRNQLHVCAVVQLDYDWERPTGVSPPLGLAVVRESMPPADADDLFRGPTVEHLLAVAAVIDFARCPVYVHCLHGQDRTGAVIAVYRHRYQGWAKERAFAEARSLGFHVGLYGLVHAWEAVP